MKARRIKLLLWATLLVALGAGRYLLYVKSPRYVLDHSDYIVLYSLQPHLSPDDARIQGFFRRNGILGQTQMSDSQFKAKLINALYSGMSSSGADMSCFNPRHGIHATYRNRTVDAEICFECGTVYFWENNKARKEYISHEPQKVFDQALRSANIPLGERPFP